MEKRPLNGCLSQGDRGSFDQYLSGCLFVSRQAQKLMGGISQNLGNK